MQKVRRALVVVDPTAATQPALDRAAWVARRLHWELHLLICIHGGLPAGAGSSGDPQTVRRSLLRHQLGYLRELAAGYRDVTTTVKAVWDRPLHEAIIRETLRCEPRLVMKDTHFHSAISRALVTNTDWHLIRECPVPLWLVRGEKWQPEPKLVAFIDPMHEHDKPAELDHRVLEEARALAEGLGGEVHAVHCHETAALIGASGALIPGAAGQLEEFAAHSQAERAERLQEVAAAHGVTRERVHLRSGLPGDTIPAATKELTADLAVMGAVSRSALRQVFLGSTAERVLDRLPCDVLVVKPPRFESPVTYRAQSPDFMELH